MAKFDVAGLIAALKNVSPSDKAALGEALGFAAAAKKVSNRQGPAVFNAEVAAVRAELGCSHQEAMKEASRRRDAASGKSAAELAAEHAKKEAVKAAYKAKKVASVASSPASSPPPAAAAKKVVPVKKAAPAKKGPSAEDLLEKAKLAFEEAGLSLFSCDGEDYYLDGDGETVYEIAAPYEIGPAVGTYNAKTSEFTLE